MAGISLYPDGDYGPSDSWGSLTNDREMWQRTFSQSGDEGRKIGQAMIAANPGTPAEEIRRNLCVPPMPATSMPVKYSPGIDDVLSVPAKPSPSGPMDPNAGQQGTSYPSLPGL